MGPRLPSDYPSGLMEPRLLSSANEKHLRFTKAYLTQVEGEELRADTIVCLWVSKKYPSLLYVMTTGGSMSRKFYKLNYKAAGGDPSSANAGRERECGTGRERLIGQGGPIELSDISMSSLETLQPTPGCCGMVGEVHIEFGLPAGHAMAGPDNKFKFAIGSGSRAIELGDQSCELIKKYAMGCDHHRP